MARIIIALDSKALFWNVKRESISGHTSTVNIPLKQGKTIKEEFESIKLIRQPEDTKKQKIIKACKIEKEGSKCENMFIFSKFAVNGVKISSDK